MKRRSLAVSLALTAAAALLLSLVFGGKVQKRAHAQPPEGVPPIQLVFGDAELVDGNLIVSWARVHELHGVKEVGVTIPLNLIDNQPQEDGDGPHGAIASLDFPEIVQDTTYLNHFEMHTQPDGHEAPPFFANPNRNRLPHFDFHFYAIPEADVWEIPEIRPWPNPLLPDVAPERLPAGYIQPVF